MNEYLQTAEFKAFLSLLVAGLWGRSPETEGIFPLTAGQWESVMKTAVKQTVVGIVYAGVTRLPEEYLPDDALVARWTVMAERIMRANSTMDTAIGKLFGMFGGKGLSPVLVKGQGLSRLYPDCNLREPGDIDIYFPVPGQRKMAEEALSRRIVLKREPDGVTSYRWLGIEVEHHGRLTDICNPLRIGPVKDIESDCGFCLEQIGGVEIQMPEPSLNLIVTSAHIMKHTIGKGVGMRQICDYAMVCQALYDSGCDRDFEQKALDRVGIGKWNRVLDAFAIRWIGLSPEKSVYGEVCPDKYVDMLMDTVLSGGNFGQWREQTVSYHKLDTAMSFLRNGFVPLARGESFWTFMSLVCGQFR